MASGGEGRPDVRSEARRASPAWDRALWLAGFVSAGSVVLDAVLFSWHHFQVDLSVYLMGGRHALEGDLYRVLLAPPRLAFTYPPFAALLFAPLTLLPVLLAQLLLGTASVAGLSALLWFAVRAARPDLDRRRTLQWSLLLMAPALWLDPVRLTIALGQINLLLAALVLGDLTTQFRVGSRALPRGLILGIVTAVKLTPLIFVPYLFVTRQVRAGCVALGSFAACTAGAAVVDPGNSWTYWTKDAFDAARVGGVYYVSNQSLRAVADRANHAVMSTASTLAIAALVAVLGIALAGWAYRCSSNLLGVLLCATTGLLVSPITWAHHLVWVVPVLVWLTWAPDRPRGGRWWALVTALLFWIAPIWWVSVVPRRELAEHGWQLLAGNSFFVAMMLFEAGVAMMLTMRWAKGRRITRRPVEELAIPT